MRIQSIDKQAVIHQPISSRRTTSVVGNHPALDEELHHRRFGANTFPPNDSVVDLNQVPNDRCQAIRESFRGDRILLEIGRPQAPKEGTLAGTWSVVNTKINRLVPLHPTLRSLYVCPHRLANRRRTDRGSSHTNALCRRSQRRLSLSPAD